MKNSAFCGDGRVCCLNIQEESSTRTPDEEVPSIDEKPQTSCGVMSNVRNRVFNVSAIVFLGINADAHWRSLQTCM